MVGQVVLQGCQCEGIVVVCNYTEGAKHKYIAGLTRLLSKRCSDVFENVGKARWIATCPYNLIKIEQTVFG
jgi:hypothetical protein